MKENETKTQNIEQPKGKKVFKAILNTIINILIVIVLITSILVAVMALTSKASGISTVFGFTIQPIQSDSMKGGSPDGYGGQEFGKGDLMIAKATNYDKDADYNVGDIVTFKSEDSSGKVMLISHRIVNVQTNENGEKLYQTQGDNRTMAMVPDQESISSYLAADDIGSVYYTSSYEGKIIKGFGAVLDYLQSQQGFFFVVLLPMIIFFMYALVRVVLSATSYKKSKAEEDKDEAVKAAVAEALAAQGVEQNTVPKSVASVPAAPAEMSAEELEQFRQFQEFQKMQKAQQAAANQPAQEANAEADSKPEE